MSTRATDSKRTNLCSCSRSTAATSSADADPLETTWTMTSLFPWMTRSAKYCLSGPKRSAAAAADVALLASSWPLTSAVLQPSFCSSVRSGLAGPTPVCGWLLTSASGLTVHFSLCPMTSAFADGLAFPASPLTSPPEDALLSPGLFLAALLRSSALQSGGLLTSTSESSVLVVIEAFYKSITK